MQSNWTVPVVTLRGGRTMPLLGFGTYQLRGEQCNQAVEVALKAGYRHIDTASVYRNGKEIRAAIERSGIPRTQLYITSKIGPKEQGYEYTLTACQNILDDLGMDYLDLLLIHWPGAAPLKPDDPANTTIRLETWKALIELQKSNKVRDIGVSNFMLPHLQHLFKHTGVLPTVNQIELHPFLVEKPTIDFCQKHSIVIQAYSPLARSDQRLMSSPILLEIAKNHHRTVPQIVLNWLMTQEFVVLPKSKNPDRIRQNFDLGFTLSAQDIDNIKKLSQNAADCFRTCWDPNTVTY